MKHVRETHTRQDLPPLMYSTGGTEYCLRTANKLHRTPLETRDSNNYRNDEAIVQCTHHVCGAALSTRLPLERCRPERPHSCLRSAAPDYLPVLFRFWRGGGPGSSLLCARPSRRGSVAHPPEISNVAKSETETTVWMFEMCAWSVQSWRESHRKTTYSTTNK